jgi:hypothetical protein
MEVVTPNPPLPPSVSTIISGVEDAITKISSILDSSKTARSTFQHQWTSLIDSYQSDIDLLDNELATLPPSLSHYMEMKERRRKVERRRKKKENAATALSGHALNFHLKTQTNDHHNNANEIFMLPPESETGLSDDEMTSYSITSSKWKQDIQKSTSSMRLSKEQKIQIVEERKFNMRERIFCKMEELRKVEMETMKQMEVSPSGAQGEGDKKASDERNKQEEYNESFERYQQKSTKLMVKMISQYKPSVKCIRKIKGFQNMKMPLLAETNDNKDMKKAANERENKMIKDPNHYCSIENLPTNTTIGYSSSLKKLVSETTANIHDDVMLNKPIDYSDNVSTNDASSYSDLDFESDHDDEDEYGSDTFDT